jgi:hypothetical protein
MNSNVQWSFLAQLTYNQTFLAPVKIALEVGIRRNLKIRKRLKISTLLTTTWDQPFPQKKWDQPKITYSFQF